MGKNVLQWILLSALIAGCSGIETKHEITPPARPARKAVKGQPQNAPPSQAANAGEAQKAADAERAGRFLDAVKSDLALSVSGPPATQESYRMRARDIVQTRLNEDELKQVAGSSDYGFLRGHALFQLGQISLDRRDTDNARKYFSSVVAYLPGTDLAQKAQDHLSQLESMKYVEAKTIGAVLPLSGKNAVLGQKVLRSIELGLGLDQPGSAFKLAVMDSEGNPDNARRGVERLVKEDNVIAIIGSLLSRTGPAVAAKAAELGVPSIALSQKAGLTEIGPTVFRNAVTSEMQVRELVRTAMNDLHLRRFAVLFPNDPYGVEFSNIFWDEVLARGGTVTAAQVYNPKDTDFRAVCQRLVGTWYIEGREDEFKMLGKEKVSEDGKKKNGQHQEQSSDDVLPPIVDFDAVFIPDSAKMMSEMAAFLSYVGLRNVKLLGTNLWSTPGLGKRAGLFANDLVYVDANPLSTERTAANGFLQAYQQQFKDVPTSIEMQAYDSALILRTLIAQGAGSRESLTRKLTDLHHFQGAVGFLEMSPQREIRRPLVPFVTGPNGAQGPLHK